MTIVVRRVQRYYGLLRRYRIRLDGTTVGRVGAGRTIEFTGSGLPQQLTASIDWVTSNELAVTDPGPAGVVEVDLVTRGVLQSMLRTFLATSTVLVLVRAGQPVPAPPPIPWDRRKTGIVWLVLTLWPVAVVAVPQALLGHLDAAELPTFALAGAAVSAVVVALMTLVLRLSASRR